MCLPRCCFKACHLVHGPGEELVFLKMNVKLLTSYYDLEETRIHLLFMNSLLLLRQELTLAL
jgi:hypothetical protein